MCGESTEAKDERVQQWVIWTAREWNAVQRRNGSKAISDRLVAVGLWGSRQIVVVIRLFALCILRHKLLSEQEATWVHKG